MADTSHNNSKPDSGPNSLPVDQQADQVSDSVAGRLRRPITEADVLAAVEQTADPGETIGASRDERLASRLLEMRADRDALITLGDVEPPAGLLDRAMEAFAEETREDVLAQLAPKDDSATAIPVSAVAPIKDRLVDRVFDRPVRWLVSAAAGLLLILGVGALLIAQQINSRSGGNPVATNPIVVAPVPAPVLLPADETGSEPGGQDQLQLADAGVGEDPLDGVTPGTEFGGAADDAVAIARINPEEITSDITSTLTNGLGTQLADARAEGPAGDLDLVPVRLTRAAELASQGRLVIRVVVPDADAAMPVITARTRERTREQARERAREWAEALPTSSSWQIETGLPVHVAGQVAAILPPADIDDDRPGAPVLVSENPAARRLPFENTLIEISRPEPPVRIDLWLASLDAQRPSAIAALRRNVTAAGYGLELLEASAPLEIDAILEVGDGWNVVDPFTQVSELQWWSRSPSDWPDFGPDFGPGFGPDFGEPAFGPAAYYVPVLVETESR